MIIDTNNPFELSALKAALAREERKPPTKRTGLTQVPIGSQHAITIKPPNGAPLRVMMTARDRREFPNARGVLVCLHASCRGRTWTDEPALRADHGSPSDLDKAGELHAWAFYSGELIDPLDPSSPIVGLASSEPWVVP